MIGREYGKLLLGFAHNCISFDSIEDILLQFDITIDSNIVMGRYGLRFYSIKSQAIRQELCACFGQFARVDIEDRMTGDEASLEYELGIIETRDALLEDAAFWISFIQEYVKKNKEMWLCHFHRDVCNIEKPLIEIYIDELTAEHLLKLKENQTIVIRKRE